MGSHILRATKLQEIAEHQRGPPPPFEPIEDVYDAAYTIHDGSADKISNSVTSATTPVARKRSVVLESKIPTRRPASKTVLNGGVSYRERAQRKLHLQRITETLGPAEARATQKRFEREDEARKGQRKVLLEKLRPYMESQLQLIELEAEEQRKEVEIRKSWSVEKLTKEGLALNMMEGYWLQNEKERRNEDGKVIKAKKKSQYLTLRTAVFHRIGKARLGWTKLQKGDQVEMRKAVKRQTPEETFIDGESRSTETVDSPDEVISATVKSITENEIRLNLGAPFHDLDLIANPLWRIDLAYNDLIEKRLKDSVEALMHDVEATQRADSELSGTSLVNILLEEGHEARAKSNKLTIARWIEENCQGMEEPDYGSLNKTQRAAVKIMLSEPISLIQGPPGTGKTSTIVAAIRLLKQHYEIPHAILLTSHTNVAVDNLAQGCKDAGLNVIRAGAMARVRESLNDITVEGLMEKHPAKPRLDDLEASKISTIKALQALQNINQTDEGDEGTIEVEDRELPRSDVDADVEWLVGQSLSADSSEVAKLQKKLSLLIQKTFVLRRDMETDIFKGVDVVCCTALSAPLIRVVDFPLVFFDEASMATEPITIATMIKGCQQLSLIGDQQQLSPLVKSRQVMEEGLGLSLFERLMARGDCKSVMLNTQHRMHPSLSHYPNKEFYKGRLKNAKPTLRIPAIESAYIKGGRHLSFVDHKGKESVTKNKSLENNREAEVLVKIIADILCRNEDISGSDIGIITPYLGQKELLWKSLQDPSSYLRALLTNEVARLGGSKSRIREVIDDIEIHTIDGFEGREKKVVVFSLVRANSMKYLGFLKEEKRWNVALTRAKNALLIVGNYSMLKRGDKGWMDSDEQEEGEEESFLHRFSDHLLEEDCIVAAEDVQS
ncbi:hypothetical protein CBS101457_002743 [Exobasidium rhododendri]|nr:hypothetical protein CBS101457_002743 [Exobasidium rhododendri]